MKKMKNLFSLLVVLTALFFFAACGGNTNAASDQVEGNQNQEEHMDSHDEAGHMENADGQEVSEVYVCPMKCEGEKTYDEAGKCPVCGMDLKVKES